MKIFGIVLGLLGVLLAAVGLTLPVVADGAARARLAATDTTVTGTGTLTQALNQDKFVENPQNPYDVDVPLTFTQVTVADPAAAAAAPTDGILVFGTEAVISRTDTGAEVDRSTARYAFTAADSQLANCCNANLEGSTAVTFAGLLPLKYPFNTQPQEYQVYNSQLRVPVSARYTDTATRDGLDLYVFRQEIPATQTATVPFSLSASLAVGVVGQLAPAVVDQLPTEGTVELYEFYAAEIIELVEPVTGYIVESQVSQRLSYRLNGGDTDIVTKSALSWSTSIPMADMAEIRQESEQLLRARAIQPFLVGGGILLTVLGLVVALRRRHTPA